MGLKAGAGPSASTAKSPGLGCIVEIDGVREIH